jgi:hypothetical protein
MRQIDYDPPRTIEREQLLSSGPRDLQAQLRRRAGGRQMRIAQLSAGRPTGAAGCQSGDERHQAPRPAHLHALKYLLYHKVRSLSCVVIYGAGGLFSTADNHDSPNAEAAVTLIS